jgi:hypothetical protein
MAGRTKNQDVRVAVGVQPTNDLNLDKEIKMLKAAILYGDKVKLYSLKIPSIVAISRFEKFPLGLRLEFIEKLLPYLSSQENARKLSSSLDEYKKINNKQNPNLQDVQFKKEFEKRIEQNWKEISDTTNKFVQNSQMDQINSAIKAGVLELHEFKDSNKDIAALNLMIDGAAAASANKTKNKTSISEQDQNWVSEFVENISNSISDDSAYPLLDDETGKFEMTGIGTDRGKQTELAKYLLEQLPLFEKASIAEILDIRKELARPLTRFRSAIIKYSDDIKAMPWGRDFPPEAEKIYHRDVKPAMLDIEDAIQSNKLLVNMLRKFTEKSIVLPVSSLFSIAISQFSSLPKELAASLGFGVAAASLLYEAYEEWARKNQITEQNQLYFYYGVGKRLNK